MSTKKQVKAFHPLIHENLDIKNELLNLARTTGTTEDDKNLKNDLASVLLYSSIAEYLAENLFESLTHFVKTSTHKDFDGILFIEKISNQSGSMTLGALIKEIDKFSFPDKAGILECFKKVCKSRNRLFHEFAKSDIESIGEMLSKDLPIIKDECEELITKINIIYVGLGKVLLPQPSNE